MKTPQRADMGFDRTVGGIAVVKKQRRVLPEDLRNGLRDGMTTFQVLDVLGPGWCSRFSGCGNIQWFFDDGVELMTRFWPTAYDRPLGLHRINPKEISNKDGDREPVPQDIETNE